MLAKSRNAGRGRKTNGFTLVELMVALTIIAMMTAISLPSFQRAIEQSRADIAAANLRAIWAAERLYWLEYHTYTSESHLETLRDLGVLDRTVASESGSSGYIYAITGPAPFEATATSQQGTISIKIDENGELHYTGITGGLQ
jgi:prepilin-type N-terminal cleavage/methylation domain-containing protein